jgi:DNA-binding MarR family transcriptional regulator
MVDDLREEDEAGGRGILLRWGGRQAILAEGFVAVPTTFLKYFGTLDPSLTPAEALFVLELMVYKWDKRSPFPGYRALAERMGVSEAYARKLARGLQSKGYLVRQARVGRTNRFDLQPLFDRLAQHATAERAKQRARRVNEED